MEEAGGGHQNKGQGKRRFRAGAVWDLEIALSNYACDTGLRVSDKVVSYLHLHGPLGGLRRSRSLFPRNTSKLVGFFN